MSNFVYVQVYVIGLCVVSMCFGMEPEKGMLHRWKGRQLPSIAALVGQAYQGASVQAHENISYQLNEHTLELLQNNCTSVDSLGDFNNLVSDKYTIFIPYGLSKSLERCDNLFFNILNIIQERHLTSVDDGIKTNILIQQYLDHDTITVPLLVDLAQVSDYLGAPEELPCVLHSILGAKIAQSSFDDFRENQATHVTLLAPAIQAPIVKFLSRQAKGISIQQQLLEHVVITRDEQLLNNRELQLLIKGDVHYKFTGPYLQCDNKTVGERALVDPKTGLVVYKGICAKNNGLLKMMRQPIEPQCCVRGKSSDVIYTHIDPERQEIVVRLRTSNQESKELYSCTAHVTGLFSNSDGTQIGIAHSENFDSIKPTVITIVDMHTREKDEYELSFNESFFLANRLACLTPNGLFMHNDKMEWNFIPIEKGADRCLAHGDNHVFLTLQRPDHSDAYEAALIDDKGNIVCSLLNGQGPFYVAALDMPHKMIFTNVGCLKSNSDIGLWNAATGSIVRIIKYGNLIKALNVVDQTLLNVGWEKIEKYDLEQLYNAYNDYKSLSIKQFKELEALVSSDLAPQSKTALIKEWCDDPEAPDSIKRIVASLDSKSSAITALLSRWILKGNVKEKH